MMDQKQKLPPIGNRNPAPASAPASGVAAIVTWMESRANLAEHGNDELVRQAAVLAQKLVDAGLNTTQIRKILARINGLSARLQAAEQFDRSEVPLLKVQLVYAAAREKQKVGPLAEVLLPAIDRIQTEDDFRWFAKFVEAVVAYHRYHGGRE